MAPILKEADTTVTTTTASAPANPAAKSPNETPTRPQPVALEIPVTINGARTVDGTDKREPFSESTQTVLVFGHGAVVRVNTPLAPGQLVFLTNEKTKKEVVSQVVKSKSGGSGGGYVELQFTEPSPGFWGLRVPSAPAAAPTAGARPVAPASPVSPAPPKSIPAAPPVAVKPVAVIPKPVAPIVNAHLPAPPMPSVVPTPPPAPTKEPEPKLVQVTPPAPVVPQSSVSPASASTPSTPAHTEPLPAPQTQIPTTPPPPPHDYSKEIEALFSVPHASPSHLSPATTPEPKAVPPSSPSSEELKLQTARLQDQLSSMLFTETPAAHPPAPVAPATPKTGAPMPASDVASKILEIAHEEPKPAVKNEVKPAPPVRRPTTPLSAEDEEVKIPAWLVPLSQNSEPAVSEPASSGAVPLEPLPELLESDGESSENLPAESATRSQASVFGGQLLGEAPAENVESSPTGSKEGLIFALAAAALLIAGGGVWHFRAALFGPSSVVSAKPASASVPISHTVASNSPTSSKTPASATSAAAPAGASTAPSQPLKNPEPVSPPVAAAVHESKKANPAPENDQEAEPPKSPLGEVHLAAPVLTRTEDTQQAGEPLPSIDTGTSNPGADAFAGVATSHRKQPVAPLPVGGEVTPAQLIKSVPPVYPPLAKTQRISGNVQIDALIDASGNVADMKIISGPPLLHRAALDAVQQWKYKPAILDGQPTSMHLTVTVQFRTQ